MSITKPAGRPSIKFCAQKNFLKKLEFQVRVFRLFCTYSTDGQTYSSDNPTFINAGDYTVYYKASKANYEDVTGDLTVEIKKATLTAAYVSETIYEGVTLHLTWNGGEDIVIPASAALTPEAGRIYYPLSYLEGMAFPAAALENPETGGVLEVTAPVQAVQPQVTAPDQGLTEAPAVIEEAPEVLEEAPEALPGVTEPQEGASESAPAASGGGLMFAGAAAVLAAAVIGLLLWRSRKGEGEGR